MFADSPEPISPSSCTPCASQPTPVNGANRSNPGTISRIDGSRSGSQLFFHGWKKQGTSSARCPRNASNSSAATARAASKYRTDSRCKIVSTGSTRVTPTPPYDDFHSQVLSRTDTLSIPARTHPTTCAISSTRWVRGHDKQLQRSIGRPCGVLGELLGWSSGSTSPSVTARLPRCPVDLARMWHATPACKPRAVRAYLDLHDLDRFVAPGKRDRRNRSGSARGRSD
jgi:hypothetical protein